MRSDLTRWSSMDTALATVSMLVEQYQARLLEYRTDAGGEITSALRLPEDRWQRRIIGHRARVHRNRIFADRVRTHLAGSQAVADQVRAFVEQHLSAA